MDFGCAAYCQYAEQCIGDLPPELVAQQEDLLKDRVAVAVKRHLKTDFKRIGHITRRARHAERLGREAGANLPVVLISALLWDLDENPDSNEAPVARAILEQLKAPPPLVDQVCAIIAARGTPGSRDNAEYQVIADADAQALREKARIAG
jgi:HD superfamily phosphodiesterase